MKAGRQGSDVRAPGSNDDMAVFRKSTTIQPLAVAMTGIKMGDQLLQIGCADRGLLVDLASKVGLSGRACTIVFDEAAAERARDTAARAGLLVDVEIARGAYPYANGTFDLVVVDNTGGLLTTAAPEMRVRSLQEAYRVVRPGGRCIVVEALPRGGIMGLIARQRSDDHFVSSGGTDGALKAEGFVGVRVLAERETRRFVEGTKRHA
jgi:SAM-dependent methyltransferase